MTLLSKSILAGAFIVVLNGVAYSKDWRGLVPLRSTRADVERLLGPPRHTSDGMSLYSNDEGIIQIFFAGSTFPHAKGCLNHVTLGTVLSIIVVLKHPTPLSEFPIDTKRARNFYVSRAHNPKYLAYYDSRNGLLVETSNGNVTAICYLAEPQDKHLCPEYYHNVKRFLSGFLDDL